MFFIFLIIFFAVFQQTVSGWTAEPLSNPFGFYLKLTHPEVQEIQDRVEWAILQTWLTLRFAKTWQWISEAKQSPNWCSCTILNWDFAFHRGDTEVDDELGVCAHMILYKYWGNSKKRRVKSVHESDVAVVNSWDDLRSFIWSSQICRSYETTLVSTWGSHQDGILSHTAVAQARTWKFVKVKETRWTLKKGWVMGNPRIYMFFTFFFHPFTWIIQNIHSEHQQWRWKKMPWGPWVSRCVLAASVFTDGLGSRIRTSAVLAETRFPTGWAWKVGESTATRDVLQDFRPENLRILELGISM